MENQPLQNISHKKRWIIVLMIVLIIILAVIFLIREFLWQKIKPVVTPIEIPNLEFNIVIPKIDIPQITVPKIPEINIPSISIPEIK